MKKLLLNNLVSNAKESTTFTFSSTQGQILKVHVGLATRTAASVSLWESLCENHEKPESRQKKLNMTEF